jgi:hypothetical protein
MRIKANGLRRGVDFVFKTEDGDVLNLRQND